MTVRTTWAGQKTATAGAIMGLLIAIVLVTALAPTVVDQSENARAWSMADRFPGGDNTGGAAQADNTPYASNAASIFAMFPLFWAIVGIGIVAGAVIASSKGL